MNTQDKDIVANAADAGNFSTLSNALKAAGLVSTYKTEGPFTMFAPTDEAFEKLPAGALNSLLRDKPKLAALLNAHVIKGAVLAQDLPPAETRNLQGLKLTFASNDEGLTVNGARVGKEIEASNGVIHAIDTVMLPA